MRHSVIDSAGLQPALWTTEKNAVFLTTLINYKTMTFEKEDIYKQDLQQFLNELKLNKHWLYALMHNAPKSAIGILWENCEENSFEKITVAEFESRYDEFHPQYDTFCVVFGKYDFEEEQFAPGFYDIRDEEDDNIVELLFKEDLAYSKISDDIDNILARYCRQAMFNGQPFVIDGATVERYGFTDTDAAYLKGRIADINSRLMAEFGAEYEKLKRIVEKGM